jgi:ubiquinone/menaquinone biosynthesis C-methylase UbiE
MLEFDPKNPQAEPMADESMVRNLAAQALAIWPQEVPLFDHYQLPERARILDVGCGTGEISSRLADRFPAALVLGVDLLRSHLSFARTRTAHVAGRVGFAVGNGFELPFADARFDLAVCRHLLQAVPEPARLVAELVRVTRPGGWLHLIPEDYGMIQMAPTRRDAGVFWNEVPRAYGAAIGCDLFIGRNIHQHLVRLGLQAIRIHYVVVDTLRVERETFAAILEAWRDGYVGPLSQVTRFSAAEIRAFFDDMIECIRNPEGYAVWQVPVVSARVPG